MSKKGIDLTGKKFGFLFVKEKVKLDKSKYRWLCQCDCGKECFARTDHLLNGTAKSCGCMQHRRSVMKHGGAIYKHRKLYKAWYTIKQRCENPNRQKYPIYGGRGIIVCDEWQDPNAFIEWALNNGYKEGLQIDRINNDGNYEPQNCRWVTSKENCRNRRSNVLLTIGGKKKTVVEWCEEKNVNPSSVYRWAKEKGKDYAERRLAEIV